MPRFFLTLFIVSLSLLALPSCKERKVCSGLNPVLASAGSAKSIRKARKKASSAPERAAMRRREAQAKGRKGFSARKSHAGKGGGLFASKSVGGGFLGISFRASGSVSVKN